jgi:hypothetical protein
VVAHHPAKQRQPGAHKAVFQLKPDPFMEPDAQQTIAPAQAGGPAYRPGSSLQRCPATRAKFTQ